MLSFEKVMNFKNVKDKKYLKSIQYILRMSFLKTRNKVNIF